MTNTIHRFI